MVSHQVEYAAVYLPRVWWPPTEVTSSAGGWVHPRCASCHTNCHTTHSLPTLLTVLLVTHAQQRLLLNCYRVSPLAPVLACVEVRPAYLKSSGLQSFPLRVLNASLLANFEVLLLQELSLQCELWLQIMSAGAIRIRVFNEMCLILQTNKRKKFLMYANIHSLVVKPNEIYLMVSCVIDSYFFQDSCSCAIRIEKERNSRMWVWILTLLDIEHIFLTCKTL